MPDAIERFSENATLVVDLSEPKTAADDCLPHAAMGLGSSRAVGTSPQPALVFRVLVQKQLSAWCVFRLDGAGGFIGDTWHPDREDAIRSACREFDLSPEDFQEMGK